MRPPGYQMEKKNKKQNKTKCKVTVLSKGILKICQHMVQPCTSPYFFNVLALVLYLIQNPNLALLKKPTTLLLPCVSPYFGDVLALVLYLTQNPNLALLKNPTNAPNIPPTFPPPQTPMAKTLIDFCAKENAMKSQVYDVR